MNRWQVYTVKNITIYFSSLCHPTLYLPLAFSVVPLFINFNYFGLSHDQTEILALFKEILINDNKKPGDILLADKRMIFSANKAKASLLYLGNESYHSNFMTFDILEITIPKQKNPACL